MLNLYNEYDFLVEDMGDVKIIIKGGDNKLSMGVNNVYVFCNYCKKDIFVVYIKFEVNGKEMVVLEIFKINWFVVVDGSYFENDYEKCKKNNDYESCKKFFDEKKKLDKIYDLWVLFFDFCILYGFYFCFFLVIFVM